jgi:hypothetical protein
MHYTPEIWHAARQEKCLERYLLSWLAVNIYVRGAGPFPVFTLFTGSLSCKLAIAPGS